MKLNNIREKSKKNVKTKTTRWKDKTLFKKLLIEKNRYQLDGHRMS